MEGSGRDPLGLSRVSDSLTSFLLPNIITTTDRARYYSFYAWAIADIEALRKTKKERVSFEDEFQRREAAFALASRMGHKTELAIVGVRQLNIVIAAADGEKTLETDFRVLPSNPTGGFGQYYEGCLRGLDLIRVNDEGEITLSDGFGKNIAEAFAASTAKTPYLTGAWRTKARVPKTVLEESAEWFSLDALGSRAAENERELLIRLFFELGEKPTATRPLNRQATLGMFLHVLKSAEDADIVVTRRSLDGDAVFWPHYYDALVDDDHAECRYRPDPVFAQGHAFWRQFCAHQFFAFAMEELLAAVLDPLTLHPEGLPMTALLDELITVEFTKDLAKVMKASCNTPCELLNAVGVSKIPDIAICEAVAKRFRGESDINEWSVCWDRDVSPETRLGRAVLLLSLLYGKWRRRDDDDALLNVQGEAKNEWWMGTIFPWVDEWLGPSMKWRDATDHLVQLIAIRHDQVKFQKRKLDASWLELANGRFVKQQDITPGFRASRHGNATTVLQDLGLIHHAGTDDPLRLTARGNQILKEVIKLRT